MTYPNSGPTYMYSFDSMYRPTGLTSRSTTKLTSLLNANVNTTHTYTAGSNNGKIASQTSSLTVGETPTYQYDSLDNLGTDRPFRSLRDREFE